MRKIPALFTSRHGRPVLALVLAVGIMVVLAVPSVFALFTNGGFESGNFNGWTKTTYLNPGLTLPQPFTGASIVRSVGGIDKTVIDGPFTQMSQTDAYTGNVLHHPKFNNYSAIVNLLGNNNNANSLKQQSTTTAADVQGDGKIHVQFAWAAVVQNPQHLPQEQPYIYVALKNVTKGNALLYEKFMFAGSDPTWQNAANSVQFTDWQVLDIAPTIAKLAVGDTIELEAIASGCSLGGHWAYLYVDGFGSSAPAPVQPVPPSPPPPAAPKEVPEGDTLLLMAGGLGGLGTWLRFKWSKAKAKK